MGHGKLAAATVAGTAWAMSASNRAKPIAMRRVGIARHPTSPSSRRGCGMGGRRRLAALRSPVPSPRSGDRMRRLTRALELLDGPLGDRVTLDGNLRDLARVNRLLGGTS